MLLMRVRISKTPGNEHCHEDIVLEETDSRGSSGFAQSGSDQRVDLDPGIVRCLQERRAVDVFCRSCELGDQSDEKGESQNCVRSA